MVKNAMASLTRQEFDKLIRDALNHLYDTPYLRKHPLSGLLADIEVDDSSPSSQLLRRHLLAAIRAMRPDPGVPAQSPDWRAYRILELRYIEVLSAKEVMQEVALGRSQYFQEQGRVLEVLVDRLWNQWQENYLQAAKKPDDNRGSQEQLVRLETRRLQEQATWEPVDVTELIEALQVIVEALARARNVTVRYNLPSRLKNVYVDRVMLRQAILNAVTCAVDLARDGNVDIEDCVENGREGIRIVAHPLSKAAKQAESGLDVCRQLVEALGGTFTAVKDTGHWEALLLWPVKEPDVLLVIDDNERLAVLFQRYLAGQNWQVLGATNGTEVRQTIAHTRPTVIVLDVMMPGEDGWELLIALKNADTTRDIPVIICSVLNEPRLAVELGANSYLQKPVNRQALVQALAELRQADPSPGSAL